MKLGIHVKKDSSVLDPPNKIYKTMVNAIETHCEVLGLDAVQIFTHGPRGYKRLEKMDYKSIYKLSKEIDISVHSSYPSVSIWNIQKESKNQTNYRRISSHIQDQLISCKKIGATGLVIHISRKPVDVILKALQAIEPIVKKFKVPILLEMISSRAHPELTYESPEKINRLVETLQPLDPNTWGICVDTAHIWGSGLDISTRKLQDDWFAKLSKKAIKKIQMFHLNGSESEKGSGTDKHAIAFGHEDKIYKGLQPIKSGLYSIIKFCQKNKITVILEINRGSEKDTINLINTIATIEKNQT